MFAPVIFFCLINGDCSFWTDDLFQNKKDCEAVVMKKLGQMDDEPIIAVAEGVCLPIKIRGT
jgi:hypothetical protein